MTTEFELAYIQAITKVPPKVEEPTTKEPPSVTATFPLALSSASAIYSKNILKTYVEAI